MATEPDDHAWPTNDPFVHAVLRSLPTHIQQTLTPEQRAALIGALAHVRGASDHLLDIRVTLPLFFERLYVVFLLGKDRRSAIRGQLIERRHKASLIAGVVFLAFLLVNLSVLVLVVAFFALYFVKSFLGIDIFPDQHLWDFFTLGMQKTPGSESPLRRLPSTVPRF